jgi:hypothetical protein
MMRSPARPRRERRTPVKKASPSRRAAVGLSPEIWTRWRALRERIGKTQGIIFRISPPRKAKSRAREKLELALEEAEGRGGSGTEILRARCPAESQG